MIMKAFFFFEKIPKLKKNGRERESKKRSGKKLGVFL